MKIFTLAEYAEGADLVMNDVSSNGSNSTVVDGESHGCEESKSNLPEKKQSAAKSSASRRATGPRTKQGKDRSKNNALKFGIFSKVVVLPGESPEEFNALLAGLRDYFQPEGFEHVLVEKLAADSWRYRRFLIAEGAEIQAETHFVEWDRKEQHRQEAARFPQLRCNGGLIRRIDNSEALEGCLKLLTLLSDDVEQDGFARQPNEELLTKLYGDYDTEEQREDWRQGLRLSYLAWSRTAAVPAEKAQEAGLASPETCKENFLADVRKEIKRLERYKKDQATVLSEKLELESIRRRIPVGDQLDRFLRYAASISRDIERTLNQLERLQRMRRGQAVPPPINVNVSSNE
jgi:hypothetical protein